MVLVKQEGCECIAYACHKKHYACACTINNTYSCTTETDAVPSLHYRLYCTDCVTTAHGVLQFLDRRLVRIAVCTCCVGWGQVLFDLRYCTPRTLRIDLMSCMPASYPVTCCCCVFCVVAPCTKFYTEHYYSWFRRIVFHLFPHFYSQLFVYRVWKKHMEVPLVSQ